jgi:hypothetical protein
MTSKAPHHQLSDAPLFCARKPRSLSDAGPPSRWPHLPGLTNLASRCGQGWPHTDARRDPAASLPCALVSCRAPSSRSCVHTAAAAHKAAGASVGMRPGRRAVCIFPFTTQFSAAAPPVAAPARGTARPSKFVEYPSTNFTCVGAGQSSASSGRLCWKAQTKRAVLTRGLAGAPWWVRGLPPSGRRDA